MWSRRLARRAPTNSDGTRRCPTRAAARMADARRCPRPASPRRDRPAGARARFPDPAERRPGSCDWRPPLPPSRGNVVSHFAKAAIHGSVPVRLSAQPRAASRRLAPIHITQVVSVAPTPLLICTPGPRAPHVIRSVDPERPHCGMHIADNGHGACRSPRAQAAHRLHHPRSLHAAERDTRYAAYAPHVCGAPDAHAWTTQETGLRQAAIQAARTCATHTARQYHRSPRPPRKRVQRKGVCTIRKMDRPDAAVGMYCRLAGAAQLRPLRV